MKSLIIAIWFLGTVFAIPNNSLKNQLKERKHTFLEKNNRMFPETSESKETDEDKRNTKNIQSIQDRSESREMETAESTKDQLSSEQGHSAQNKIERKSGFQNSQLDTVSIFSQEYLRNLDPAERPTVNYNVSQTEGEGNESVSHESIDDAENSDDGVSEEYASKEEDQDVMLRQVSEDTQEVQSDSLEQDTQEYNASVHQFEDDEVEESRKEGDDVKKLQSQLIAVDENPQNSEEAEETLKSNLDMEETSQNPPHTTQKNSGVYEGIQDIFTNILEATFGGEKLNAMPTEQVDEVGATSTEEDEVDSTSTEQGGEVDVLQSREDSDRDQHNREREDVARSQSLYEDMYLDTANVHIKDKSFDAVENKDSMKLPEMGHHTSRSEGATVPQANRNRAKGHEHLQIVGSGQQTQEGDGSADANETGEERHLNILMKADVELREPVNTSSMEEMSGSASGSKENVTTFATLNYDVGGLTYREVKEDMVDPCLDFHCKQGKICEADKEDLPKCVCQDVDSCPQTLLLYQVCGTDNITYDSECHLFATKCQLEGTKRGSRLHLDYKGSCKRIPPCSEYELAQFPLRMRDWLKNVLVQLYESDPGVSGFLTEKQRNKVKKIYQHEKRLMNGNHTLDLLLRDFEKNYRMYVYPVHWQFSQLDHHPADRRLSHSELAPLRAPLVPMEHCITDFFKGCNTDKNKYVSLKEWCFCFGIKDEDIRESLLF